MRAFAIGMGPPGGVFSVGHPLGCRYRDGKCVSFNLMYDQLLLLEQLGLMQAQ